MTNKEEFAKMMFTGSGLNHNAPVTEISLDDLVTFHTGQYGHLFDVVADSDMDELMESMRDEGQLEPIIVRPDSMYVGKYEIISGHRRVFALTLLGYSTVKAVIIDCDDEKAIKLMIASNLMKRSDIPISTKAKAMKMYLDANKKQGARTDLTSDQLGPKLDTLKDAAEIFRLSKSTAKRVVRLTNLIPELQNMVDDKEIPVGVGVELSYLTPNEQLAVYTDIDSNTKHKLSIEKANELHMISEKNQKKGKEMSEEEICAMLIPEPKPQKFILNEKYLTEFLPADIQNESSIKKAEFIVYAIKEYRMKRGE